MSVQSTENHTKHKLTNLKPLGDLYRRHTFVFLVISLVFCSIVVFVFLLLLPNGMGAFANTMSIVSALFAFLASALSLRENHAQRNFNNQTIPMFFKNIDEEDVDKQCIKTFLSLARGDVSRYEVLGYIGMLSQQRFEIEYVRTKAFLDQIKEVQQGNRNALIISCSAEELEQFNIEKIDPPCTYMSCKDL